MKAVRLTLICHALTQAQKTGCLHRADDGILPLDQQPGVLLPGIQVLTAPEPASIRDGGVVVGVGAVRAGLGRL